MPIYDSGRCICSRCNKQFDWVYYIKETTNIRDGKIKFEKLPTEQQVAEISVSPDKVKMYKVKCKYCCHINIFPVDKQ